MNTNNRYFAEVFFRSKKGNPCAYHLYMDAVNEEEVYMNIVGKVKRLKYFDRVDRVDIVKMNIMAIETK
jgi:hypothetical protein